MVAATKFFAQNIIARAISARPLNTRDVPDNSDIFGPKDIFTPSVKGAVYDYDDLSYLYQKSDGSVPVTALEQPVGLVVDKRWGGVRGADVKARGAPSEVGTVTDATYDTSTGVGTSTRIDGANQSGVKFSGLTPFGFYAIAITNGATNIVVRTGNVDGTTFSTVAAGDTTTVFALASSLGQFSITAPVAATATFTISSVRELPGIHAFQATDAARPVLSARYNLLVGTTFARAVAGTPGTAPTGWTLTGAGGTLAVDSSATDAVLTFSATAARQYIAQNVTLAANTSYTYTATLVANGTMPIQELITGTLLPSGSVSYAINGASVAGTVVPVAGDSIACVIAIGVTGGAVSIRMGAGCSGNVTGSVSLSKPDLRLTADANARLPAYQRVTTSTDYDSAGFPRFLRIDATDDFLQTPSVDPGTDKVFVCAGVTKMSDAGAAILLESSANTNTTAGAFYLAAPGSAFPNFAFASRGSAASVVNAYSGFAAPLTGVLTGIGGISGDSCGIRVNGTAYTPTTTDQGTGNYTAQPLYIGARAGTSLRLNNGRIYPMVICFKAVTAGEIAATEQWLRARCPAVF